VVAESRLRGIRHPCPRSAPQHRWSGWLAASCVDGAVRGAPRAVCRFDVVQASEGRAATLLAGRPGEILSGHALPHGRGAVIHQPIREEDVQGDETGHGGDGGSRCETAPKTYARSPGPASVP
jgi:hypothetical protein